MKKISVFSIATGSLLIAQSVFAQNWNPSPNWEDSYSVGGVCYCNSSNYDHGLDTKTAPTPIGELNVVEICNDIRSVLGEGSTNGRIPYNDIQCGNGPANDAADEAGCPGRVDIGSAGCDDIGPTWDLDSVYGTGGGNTGGGGSSDEVRMVKRNASNFAMDGGSGGANGQSIELWDNIAHNNLTWTEIDRGNGYYSYQKLGTNFCIDGDNDGANGQDVYLWQCSSNNQNQHWKKIDVGNGNYVLQKRNAPDFAIDGNRGGARNQNVYLWRMNTSNQNQHWSFQ